MRTYEKKQVTREEVHEIGARCNLCTKPLNTRTQFPSADEAFIKLEALRVDCSHVDSMSGRQWDADYCPPCWERVIAAVVALGGVPPTVTDYNH